MKALFAAIQFLTVIPLPVRTSEDDLGRSIPWFPLAGCLIGIITGTGFYLLSKFVISGWIPAVVAVILLVVTSGALHLDGLADSADGLFSHRPRDRKLEIMRDSRIGTYGVLAIILVIVSKIAALSYLSAVDGVVAILSACLISRTIMAILLNSFPYARKDSGMADCFIRNRKWFHGIIAIILGCGGVWLLASFTGLLLMFASLVLGILICTWTLRSIGGITGDVIGACSEIVEMTSLVTMTIIIECGYGIINSQLVLL